jgi:hypothetical protein
METAESVIEMSVHNESSAGTSNSVRIGTCDDIDESTNKSASKRMKLTLLSLVLYSIIGFPLLFWPVAAHAGKHAYPEFLPTISYEVIEVLIKHGMSASHDRENPWFKISGIPGSYTIYLYLADEIPEQAVMDITKLCLNYYETRNRRERFSLLIYYESSEERRKSLFFGIGSLARIKPFFELTIGRTE